LWSCRRAPQPGSQPDLREKPRRRLNYTLIVSYRKNFKDRIQSVTGFAITVEVIV